MSDKPETKPNDPQTTDIQVHQRMQMIPVSEIRARRMAVAELVRQEFHEDVHFGAIPGCGDKKVMLKAGSDLAAMSFMLGDHYESKPHDLPGGHREYETTCTLKYIPTGAVVAQGVGLCSSLESKYRYRGTQVEST